MACAARARFIVTRSTSQHAHVNVRLDMVSSSSSDPASPRGDIISKTLVVALDVVSWKSGSDAPGFSYEFRVLQQLRNVRSMANLPGLMNYFVGSYCLHTRSLPTAKVNHTLVFTDAP